LAHRAPAAPYQEGNSPTSRCDLNNSGKIQISDAQKEVLAALGNTNGFDALHNYDLNNDGVVNVVDIETVVDAALNEGCAADNTAPTITEITPLSGKAGQTITVTVTGQGLYGAVLTLQSVDPIHMGGTTSVTAVSETGTSATFSIVLGGEGPYNPVITNFVGADLNQPVLADVPDPARVADRRRLGVCPQCRLQPRQRAGASGGTQ
jgi:hypothetical protein